MLVGLLVAVNVAFTWALVYAAYTNIVRANAAEAEVFRLQVLVGYRDAYETVGGS